MAVRLLALRDSRFLLLGRCLVLIFVIDLAVPRAIEWLEGLGTLKTQLSLWKSNHRSTGL
jgi:hypothetical protein